MIFDSILEFLINLFRSYVNFFIDFILDPLFDKLINIIPNLSDYMSNVTTYLNTYFYNGIAFAKNVFLNVTGYPGALLRLLIIFFAYKFVIMFSFFLIKHALNAWSLFRAGRSVHSFIGGESK